MRFVSGLYFPGSDPTGDKLGWSIARFRCERMTEKDYRFTDKGPSTRYITLSDPMGYATYKDIPADVAARFDQVLDSLCCGECSICKAPKR